MTRKGESKYGSVYVHNNEATHHLPNVSISELIEAVDEQLDDEFYLNTLGYYSSRSSLLFSCFPTK